MYFKLATENIKKSFKDYTIYFLTLILAVCIFYSFNAMDAQKIVTDMKNTNMQSINKLTDFMAIISVFVSIILGGLMIYANNFLIKKRKKEFGIYMTLGMGKRKISKILVVETFLVGIISLGVGLILGIGASQMLSAFTLKLFEVELDQYKFAISVKAIGKTIIYFGIMFLLVMIFNVFIISKYKIIDLLMGGRKNENIKVKKSFIYWVSFILCVVSLSFAYVNFLRLELDFRNHIIKMSTGLLIIGTVLFFFSLTGVILYIVNKNKKVYFKKLNIFVVKQLNSKINTNFISMSLISLMLFFTILILSVGIGFKKDYEAGLKKQTPFDASIIVYNHNKDGKEVNLEEILKKIDFKKSENEKYVILNQYLLGVKREDLLKTKDEVFKGFEVGFVKISEYNRMLKIKGEKEESLNKDQVLLMSNVNDFVKPLNKILKDNNKVNIKGKEYVVRNAKLIEDNLYTNGLTDNYLTIVANDEVLTDYTKITISALNVIYSDDNREENNKKYIKIQEDYMKDKFTGLNGSVIQAFAKDERYSGAKAGTTNILFVAMYLGIVFLITSMAVLALQQLSEASDSIERYKSLRRIGANSEMINRTIFTQTLVYFSLPVIIALIHSIVGVTVIHKELNSFTQIDIRFSVLITILVLMVVYTGYFYTTYSGYKRIVKNNIS